MTDLKYYKSIKNLIAGPELVSYFEEHVVPYTEPRVASRASSTDGFYSVVKTIKAFKRVRTVNWYNKRGHERLICALEIPVGAVVFASHDYSRPATASSSVFRKMRASVAVVHNIYTCKGALIDAKPREQDPYARVCSIHDHDFSYWTGKVLKPRNPFSMRKEQCASGIHFFLNFRDAFFY